MEYQCEFRKMIASSSVFLMILLQPLVILGKESKMTEVLTRPIRAVTYPPGSSMGMFMALSVPIENSQLSVSMSYFFEASYGLPANATDLEPWMESYRSRRRQRRQDPPKKPRIDRRTIFRVLENKLQIVGIPGRECLLKAICEASEYPLRHNGVLGEILHVIFTPSTSRQENLPLDIVEAELIGRNGTCLKYQPLCPVGLLDLIGILL